MKWFELIWIVLINLLINKVKYFYFKTRNKMDSLTNYNQVDQVEKYQPS